MLKTAICLVEAEQYNSGFLIELHQSLINSLSRTLVPVFQHYVGRLRGLPRTIQLNLDAFQLSDLTFLIRI